jgi:hypothetical protein
VAINRLTNNSDETDVSGLLAGDSVFSVPYFQRPYKWGAKRLKNLERDILNVIDGQIDSHFLGAVILHGRRSNPSDPDVYEIIDGQQRITTVFLYIAAAVKTLCKHDCHDEALGLFQKYLALGRTTGLVSNLKLHPCKEDRVQVNKVISDLLGDALLVEKLGSYKPKPMPAGGIADGPLLKNYRAASRFFDDQFKQGEIERIRAIYSTLLDRMSIVQIDVKDPTDGPRIFDSLNSRQEPMTVGDLIRNEIFSKVADKDADEIELTDREYWQPFYEKFRIEKKNYFDSYFFPFGLILNPALSKSEVFAFLHERWRDYSGPEKIIEELAAYQDAFLDLVRGTNLQGHPADVSLCFQRLHRSKAPSSVYPFLMKLSNEIRSEAVSKSEGKRVLEVVESFLVRRAVCGIEPTGLHAVFKGLWQDVSADLSAEKVENTIRGYGTVSWPSDAQFVAAIQSRKLYGTGIVNFLVREINLAAGGDVPSDIPWIEHILPRSPSNGWAEKFSNEEHKMYLDTLANLIPLSSKMNQELSNGPYSKKREVIIEDSMFKSARKFAEDNEDWTPVKLTKRAEVLSSWAIKRWPR